MLDRAAKLLLAGVCLAGATACDDGGPTSPTPTETMIAPASVIGRTVAITIGETHTRCTAPPGTVIHYYFEDADTLRGVRADGIFDYPTKAWSYTRTGARSAQIEITWANDGRSEIELVFSADDRGTFEQRDCVRTAAALWSPRGRSSRWRAACRSRVRGGRGAAGAPRSAARPRRPAWGHRWCGPGRDARRSTRCGSGRLSRMKSVRAGRCRRPESGSASSRSRCCERPAADVRRCRARSAAAARSTACRDLVVVEGNLLCDETRGPGLAAGQCPAVRTVKGGTVRDHDPLQNCRSSKATRRK